MPATEATAPTATAARDTLDRADLAERLFDEIVAEAGELATAYSRGDHHTADECRDRLSELCAEFIGACDRGPIKYRRN